MNEYSRFWRGFVLALVIGMLMWLVLFVIAGVAIYAV